MYDEGKAILKFTDGAFINPEAKLSRDLSVALVSMFAKKSTRILDPTAATAIRGIRYYKETKSKDVTMLEINEKVSKVAAKNIKSNGVKARLLNKSIQEFANTSRETFDVIDLDPFGSIAPNLYDTLKMAHDKTYLFLTATDTAVLCGAQEKACVRIYDAKPMHNELCHETGLRILLGYVARTAAQFNYGIEPILSISYAHYMRLFLRLVSGAKPAQASISELGYAHYCSKCGFRNTEQGAFPRLQKCPECGTMLETAGKMWVGSIQEKKTISKIAAQFAKEGNTGSKIISKIDGEYERPLYYSIPKLTKKLNIPAVSPKDLIEKLREAKFVATRTHFDDSSIKTDAGIRSINKMLVDL